MASLKIGRVKIIAFIIALLPVACFAQFTISGKVINQADTKPVANASIFLSNATIGDKTADDGTFTLHNVKTGKYELIVSVIGFQTYHQLLAVNNNNIVLQPILLSPKTIVLSEVTIKPKIDANTEKYLELFKQEFLGKSDLAKDCKITNPEIIDFDYDDEKNMLSASSSDFINIENHALGYKIKYLLTNFTLNNKDVYEKKSSLRGFRAF